MSSTMEHISTPDSIVGKIYSIQKPRYGWLGTMTMQRSGSGT